MGIMSSASWFARMAILVGLVVAALAATASAVPVTSTARSAPHCMPVRVNGGQGLGRVTVRLGRIGDVSCATARHLAHTYFHKIATGQCGQQNNFCDLSFQGWDCSIFFATESQQAGGAAAGCARVRGGARVRFFYKYHAATVTVGRLAAPRLALAAERFEKCANYNALHVGFHVHRLSCAVARRILRAYLYGNVGTGGIERVKRYPAWKCSTGDRSGLCSKGRVASGVPEIDFFYLEPPG